MEISVEFAGQAFTFLNWRSSSNRIANQLAVVVATTLESDDSPDIAPHFVIAAVFDGKTGAFVEARGIPSFLQSHYDATMMFHGASRALECLARVAYRTYDVYQAVEAEHVRCTLILHRLLRLATEGDTAREECGLRYCSRQYLGADVPSAQLGWCFGRAITRFPPKQLRVLARQAIATWRLHKELESRIRLVQESSSAALGFVDHEWLSNCTSKFGPLSHHVQLRADSRLPSLSVVMS